MDLSLTLGTCTTPFFLVIVPVCATTRLFGRVICGSIRGAFPSYARFGRSKVAVDGRGKSVLGVSVFVTSSASPAAVTLCTGEASNVRSAFCSLPDMAGVDWRPRGGDVGIVRGLRDGEAEDVRELDFRRYVGDGDRCGLWLLPLIRSSFNLV